MAQLAIRGHASRGKEVIELLEMLGGKNTHEYYGDRKDLVYFITSDYSIENDTESNTNSYKSFSLEEFLEKFPYKVGDKVIIKSNNQEVIVTEVTWEYDIIMYRLKQNDDLLCKYIAYEIQPYKEATMKENLEQIILDIPNGYEFFGINDDNKVVLTKKQSKYPTTYEECCEIMGIDVSRTIEHDDCPFYKDVTCYEYALLSSLVHLRKLIICRDTYWKIAGEEMGLGEPWKPDWSSCEEKFCITIFKNKQTFDDSRYISRILAFPTEEILYAFNENFKDLIEQCKELL